MTHPTNADPLAPILASVINRIEIHTHIIKKNPKPHMQQFDRGQLYAIEKVLEFLYEELREGSS